MRGELALSVACGDSSPGGRAKLASPYTGEALSPAGKIQYEREVIQNSKVF